MESVLVCGCGRIGSPLLTFMADQGFRAYGVDVDESIFGKVTARFKEEGWQEMLTKLGSKVPEIYSYENLSEFYVKNIGAMDVCIITCGTPVDNNQNPDTSQLTSCVDSLVTSGLVDESTLVILRSTIFPGGTRWLSRYIQDKHEVTWRMVFCPERIAEGYTFKELKNLPQIIAGDDAVTLKQAVVFFEEFSNDIQVLYPNDGGTAAGELAKLMCNVWRYITFATANEFSMVCDSYNADFNAVRNAINTNYNRANIPLAALNLGGPCLGKDSKILSAFTNIDEITEAAYHVAEKTCIYYIDKYKDRIKDMHVAVLGLGFKPNSDNNMNSLSYKAIRHLEVLNAAHISVHDPYIPHKKYGVDLEEALEADLIIVMTEHKEFKELYFAEAEVIRL